MGTGKPFWTWSMWTSHFCLETLWSMRPPSISQKSLLTHSYPPRTLQVSLVCLIQGCTFWPSIFSLGLIQGPRRFSDSDPHPSLAGWYPDLFDHWGASDLGHSAPRNPWLFFKQEKEQSYPIAKVWHDHRHTLEYAISLHTTKDKASRIWAWPRDLAKANTGLSRQTFRAQRQLTKTNGPSNGRFS